jgi:hypothetical protein
MTDRGRELLPPAQARSWDEFEARWVIERARFRKDGRSWKDSGRIAASVIPGLAAVVFWVAFAVTAHADRWVLLVLALVCTALCGWLVSSVLRPRWRAGQRRRELDRLSDEWHARLERGELPRTTPDGSKVWRDEIRTEVPEDKQTSLPNNRLVLARNDGAVDPVHFPGHDAGH